jgi:FkbM family methyltransferase
MNCSPELIERRRWKKVLWNNLLEDSILRVLREYMYGCRTSIDVGGNTGYQAYYQSLNAQRVLTFEPVPDIFEVLKENLSNARGVEFHNAAVSDHDGKMKLFLDVNRGSMTSQIPLVEKTQEFEIDCVSLDSLDVDDVDFIKIDVEGYEIDVLRGAVDIIDGNLPTVMVEIYQPWCDKTGNTAADIFSFFEQFDDEYRCYYYNKETRVMDRVWSVDDGVEAVKNLHHLHDGDFLFVHSSKETHKGSNWSY